jgi:hypothetical protein
MRAGLFRSTSPRHWITRKAKISTRAPPLGQLSFPLSCPEGSPASVRKGQGPFLADGSGAAETSVSDPSQFCLRGPAIALTTVRRVEIVAEQKPRVCNVLYEVWVGDHINTLTRCGVFDGPAASEEVVAIPLSDARGRCVEIRNPRSESKTVLRHIRVYADVEEVTAEAGAESQDSDAKADEAEAQRAADELASVGLREVKSPDLRIEGASGRFLNPENVLDDDDGSCWNSGGHPPAWIRLDLGERRTVRRVHLLALNTPGVT